MATQPPGFPIPANFFARGQNIDVLEELLNRLKIWTDARDTELEGLIGVGGNVVLASGSTKTSYATIAAALAASIAGDAVIASAGTFSESVTIPAGVCLIGAYGARHTTIDGAAATGVRITLGEGASIAGIHLELPTDAVSAVEFSGTTNAAVNGCTFEGKGGSGQAIENSGTGSLVCFDIGYTMGDCLNCFVVSAGQLNISTCTIASSAGIISHAFHAVGGELNMEGILATPSGVSHAIHCENAKVRGQGVDVRNASVAVHVTHASADVRITGFRAVDTTNEVLLIAPALGAGPSISLQGEFSRNKVTYDAGYSNVTLVYIDRTAGDEGQVVDGELAVGRPEAGREAVFGEGDSYVRGMKVLTSDGTAAPGADGGNLTDASTEASSIDASTFTFQGLTAGHAIYFGSSLDGASDKLKHWGVKVSQGAAMTSATARPFVFEIWDGAAWAIIPVFCSNSSLFHRYANDVFRRANTSDHIRYGAGTTSAWAKKTLDGSNLYWSRIRLVADLTQLPTFDQFKLSTSRVELNSDGTLTSHGIGRWRQTIVSALSAFGDGGGVANSSFQVGTGGGDGQWNHQSADSKLNSNSDQLTGSFVLPLGICTACPIRVRFKVIPTVVSTDATIKVALKPQEVAGVLVSDPAGGIAPVARAAADVEALDAVAGQAQSLTPNFTVADIPYELEAGPFWVDDYYEGDVIFVKFELDNHGAASVDIDVVTAEVEGSNWTLGGK